MVLMHSLEVQSIVKVNPVATLMLKKNALSFPVVIAVPADSTLQSIRARDFADLITEYDPVRLILQQWFLNYQGREMFGIIGWRDEHFTRQLIRDWKLRE
jgi:hypothetical protein